MQERIDRLVGNKEWLEFYSESEVRHLYLNFSNHRTIMVKLESAKNGDRLKRPFRYEPLWLLDDTFNKVVKEAWQTNTY